MDGVCASVSMDTTINLVPMPTVEAGDDQTLVVDPTVTSKGKSLPSHPSASAPLCCGSVAVKVKLFRIVLVRFHITSSSFRMILLCLQLETLQGLSQEG